MFKAITVAFIFLMFFNSCAVKQKSLAMNDWYGFTKNDTERIAPSQVYEFTEGMIRM